MRKSLLLVAWAMGAVSGTVFADSIVFNDDFHGKLGEGWTWVRENPEAWRTTEAGLEIKIEPGNLWGGTNNAKNVLVRDLPKLDRGALSASVVVENKPTNQYEQVNLVWYYDDSNMVKIGLELVDGEVCLVMGREENDKTRTIAKPPVGATTLQLRLTARGNTIQGEYRTKQSEDWRVAGECELPVKGRAKISLQAYQGPPDAEHWARISKFLVTRSD